MTDDCVAMVETKGLTAAAAAADAMMKCAGSMEFAADRAGELITVIVRGNPETVHRAADAGASAAQALGKLWACAVIWPTDRRLSDLLPSEWRKA